MIVTRDEARRTARLAQLALDDAALDRMAGEMSTILDYIDQLREVDVSGVISSDPAATRLREDDVLPGGPERAGGIEAVAANAPAWRDGLFVVPKVIGGE